MFLFLGDHVFVERRNILVFHVHHFLQFVDVDFLDVLLARRPLTLANADNAADDLDETLQQQKGAGQGEELS